MRTIPTDAAVSRDLLSLPVRPSDVGGFASRSRCRAAAALLHDDWRDDHGDDAGLIARTGDLARPSSISVTPGGLVLRRRTRPVGREAHEVDQVEHRHHVVVPGTEYSRYRGEIVEQPTTVRKDLDDTDLCPSCGVEIFDEFLRGLVVALGHVVGPAPALHGPPAPRPVEPSRWWSSRSRTRMIRALASIDWTPVFFLPRTRPGMVTLTYPGDWLTVAPDAETTKGHLRRLHERLRRLYAANDLGEPVGVWKLEFQARGAPHFHLYLPVPIAQVRYRGKLLRFRDWLSAAWSEIVDHPDPEERARHLAAGTGIDFGEGARCSDPKRLAVYFTRHNAKGGRSKAHQHRVPDAWCSAGRWWGTWGVDRIDEEAPVSDAELVEVKRLLRGWIRSQGRTVETKVRRINTRTGEVGHRWVTRRYAIRSLSMSLGGFVIANDGPALAAMVSRYLERLRSTE